MGVRAFDLSGVASRGAPRAGFLNDILASFVGYVLVAIRVAPYG